MKNEGHIVRRCSEIVDIGISHFWSIYKEPNMANIVEIMKLTTYFTSFVFEEDN